MAPLAVLVGLPGSGKSTVGAAVARQLGWEFLDLDHTIAVEEGASIATIFSRRGETAYRKLERGLTERLAGRENLILAPGGGWMTVPGVVALLRPPARIIHLLVRPETAYRRLGAGRLERPLLAVPDPLAVLRRLGAERAEVYAGADFVVDTDRLDLQQVVHRVAELVSACREP